MKQPVPFGSYKLLERISVGGMAEVFRAITARADLDIQHLVAIKRILPNIAEDDEFIRMFLDEAKLAAQLHHANIAQIEQIGQLEGVHYIVLEHVHGRDLKSVFERLRYRNEPMPVAQACIIAMKVCEGLDYAHNKHDQSGAELGLVHRDVSPQNVLVSFEGEVKLIDFGIAKATSKGGGTTQAGVLKGKLGYLSPEQVRGLPVDRRTDVFACGIVLYEMLTGERLFAGGSDFSTLEKVRNVDIDPPTVHNPKLPRELEQIVLRALAVDPAERYQHAIDLHDALQDLVYTTGAFCSRKELSAWMKSLFAKDYDEEIARFNAYYQGGEVESAPVTDSGKRAGSSTLIAPAGPPAAIAVVPSTPTSTPALRAVPAGNASGRRTFPMGSLVAAKPPPPPGRSQQLAVPTVTPMSAPVGAPAASVQLAADEEPTALTTEEPIAAKLALVPAEEHAEEHDEAPARPPVSIHDTRVDALDGLDRPSPDAEMSSWEDDEEDLETQIYDNDFESAPVPRSEVRAAPSASARVRPVSQQPSARVRPASQQPSARQAVPQATGRTPSRSTSTRPAVEPYPEPSRPVASGANRAPAPEPAAPRPAARGQSVARELPRGPEQRTVDVRPEPRASARAPLDTYDEPAPRLAAERPEQRELAAPRSFGTSVLNKRPQRSLAVLGLGGAALVIGGVALALWLGGESRSGGATPAVAADDATGFDLYVDPAGITRWRLDGELRTDRLPSRIRGIAPGVHAVVIEAPPGFMSQSQNVTVVAGQAPKVKIELPVMEITGVFQSDPPGASIFLITDGERKLLGPSPATHRLDPRKQYSVLFEMPGYVSTNRPISLSGLERESITVVLERATGAEPSGELDARPLPPDATPPAVAPTPPVAATPPKSTPSRPAQPAPRPTPPKTQPRPPTTPKAQPPDEAPDPGEVSEGTLLLSAKPPCQILIDGKATGLTTPQRELLLSVGSHRITLVNEEYSINETFTVQIKADVPAKVIKDYSDRLSKEP